MVSVTAEFVGSLLYVVVAMYLALAWVRGMPAHWKPPWKRVAAGAILLAAAVVWPLVAVGFGVACLLLSVRIMREGMSRGDREPPGASAAP